MWEGAGGEEGRGGGLEYREKTAWKMAAAEDTTEDATHDTRRSGSMQSVPTPCSGSRVQGPGFRFQGSGCRVQGAGIRVQGGLW